MTTPSSFDLLLEWKAAHHPGARIIKTWPLSGGVSSTMLGFSLQTDEGQRELILRAPSASSLERDPRAVETEWRLLTRLHALGVPCPQPWCTSKGKGTSEPPADARCLVVSFLKGAPLLTHPISEQQIGEMAQQLAAIHELDAAPFRALGLSESSPLRRQPGSKDLERLEKHFPYSRVLAAFHSLGAPSATHEPCLLHGDFWPGNLLWHQGHLSGVIDWEDSCIGDPLVDLAITRLDLRWIFGSEVMDCFTDLYGQIRPVDADRLDRWDLVAALRPGCQIETWAQSYPLLGRSDIDAEHMERVRTEHALEVIARRLAR